MNRYYLLLTMISCMIITSCTDDPLLFDNFESGVASFIEVQVVHHDGEPAKNVRISYGHQPSRFINSAKTTDSNGYLKIELARYIDKNDLLEGGFIQAIPNEHFLGGYLHITDLDGIQVIQAPKEEEITVELLSEIDQAAFRDGAEQDISIKVSATTRLPFFGVFSSALAYDGQFINRNGYTNYDCPPADNNGVVNFTFVKQGEEPLMQIEVIGHNQVKHYQTMNLMEL